MKLSDFPSFTVPAGTALHRIHRAKNAPWWFSSDGAGRFDPMGAADVGSCYVAEEELGAWVEVFRAARVIAEGDVRDRRLCSPTLSRDLTVADATSRDALRFGVTASLGAGEDYRHSQELAAAAVAEGFAGVRYLLRHDPSQSLAGLAIFGPAGAADPDDPEWRAQPDVEIPHALVEAASDAFGYRVVPRP